MGIEKENEESNKEIFEFVDSYSDQNAHPLSKSISALLDSRTKWVLDNSSSEIPERKSYTIDPNNGLLYSGLYRKRFNLLPYSVIKSMIENNEFLAAILNTRANQLSSFGQPQVRRYDMGYKIVYRRPSEIHLLSKEEKFNLDRKICYARDLFYTCGKNDNLNYSQMITFPEFLQSLAKFALGYGFCAVEIVYDIENNFHSFRLVDSGTIYKAPCLDRKSMEQNENDNDSFYQQIDRDFHELNSLQGKEQIDYSRLNSQSFKRGEYSWVQVINDIPRMAFRDKELLVYNYYPSSSIEYAGYPRPPIDDVARSLTTNLNAMMHNHLFFFQGRGTKGGLFIKSDNLTENTLNRIRLHMQSSINSVKNAFRMPIVGLPTQDAIEYVSFDQGNRDQEFAYLSENTMRNILAAYNMAPEELSAMSFLNRGSTPSNSLADSNNEYKLQVSRSAGFQPFLKHTQTLMNRILSIIDPEVYKHCVFKFVGLDAEDPIKESTRLQTDMNLHMTFNEVLLSVEKDEVPVGGNFPLNPQFLNMLKDNIPMNVLLHAFTGNKSFLLDPSLNFYQNGFWFQYQSVFQNLLSSKGRIKHSLEEFTQELKNLLIKKDKESLNGK